MGGPGWAPARNQVMLIEPPLATPVSPSALLSAAPSPGILRPVELLILFAWSFAAATILPLSSEIPLALAVNRSGAWITPVMVATAGNFLGACTTYWLARYAMDRAAPAHSRRVEHASRLVNRYGPPALLLSWVPLVGDALVALAGAAHMRFWPFSSWTLIGKAARYIDVAWLVK